MKEHELAAVIAGADDAINREDFDALLDFDAEDAVLVVRPGQEARGKDQIRKAFPAIADYFDHSLNVRQGRMSVIEAGDTALVVAETFVASDKNPDPELAMQRKATYVFARDETGAWRCVIDNSYGTDLLETAS